MDTNLIIAQSLAEELKKLNDKYVINIENTFLNTYEIYVEHLFDDRLVVLLFSNLKIKLVYHYKGNVQVRFISLLNPNIIADLSRLVYGYMEDSSEISN